MERNSNLRTVVDNGTANVPPRASDLVQGSVKLVSLPHVCIRINMMVDDPDFTASDVGQVIMQDASLSARLLKIANSPFYGFQSRIDTISRAVTVIGQRDLRDLVFAVSAVRTFSDIPTDLANMASFWRHSIFTGIVARLLASRCSVLHTERLFVMGLLHDLGQLLMFHKLPELSKTALRRSAVMEEPHYLSERHVIGYDHGEVGGYLVKLWSMPDVIQTAIHYHHTPSQAPESLEAALIHLANAFSDVAENAAQREQILAKVDPHAWKLTGLGDDIVEEVIAEAHPLLFEGLAMILPRE